MAPSVKPGQRLTGDLAAEFSAYVVSLYSGPEQMVISAICEKTGRSYGNIHRILKDADVSMRTHGGAHRRTRLMTGRRDWGLPELPTGQIIAGNYVHYLRNRLKLRVADVRGLAGLSHSTMRRTESGARPLSQKEAETLLAGPYRVSEPGRRGFARFLYETDFAVKHREVLPLDRAVDCTTGWPDRLAALEHRATDGHIYAQRLVPGFLRTPGYTARITDSPDPTDLQITRPATVGARTTVVLEESVLMRLLGAPPIFATQMQYLIDAVDEQRIKVRVLPLDSAVHGEFPEHLAELILPNGTRFYAAESDHATYYSGPAAERRLGGFLARVTEAALPEDQSRTYLELARDKAHTGDRIRLL